MRNDEGKDVWKSIDERAIEDETAASFVKEKTVTPGGKDGNT